MTFLDVIYAACLLWGAWAALLALNACRGGMRFYRYVCEALKQSTANAKHIAAERRIAVIMPCKGVDEKLRSTIDAFEQQTVRPARIVFTLESESDPAYQTLKEWTQSWRDLPCTFVIAGIATDRGQKIHNLLAAVDSLDDDIDTLVFVDSDAVPGDDWLAHLVAPLSDSDVGATTGYRWYTAIGGMAAGMRTAWNAATLTTLADERRNFAWGGSTALRRADFETLGIHDAWRRALSDDLVLTRCLRAAGRRIRFVPQALVASTDRTTLGGFLEFATRQMIITRICAQQTWRRGFFLVMNLTFGGTAVAVLTLAYLFEWFGTQPVFIAAAALWALLMLGAAGEAVFRQLALRRLLSAPNWTWRDAAWDIGGTLSFGGSLHSHLFFKSMFRRRIWWRNTLYEMPSADETRILDRR